MAENNQLLDLDKLYEYLRLVPQAVQDPAFYQIALTGLEPQQAAAQNLSTGNQLTQLGAGALQGAANVGNAFANLIDPLASAIESKFGTFTAGGLFPTVAEARATRDKGKSNYDAIYGGSIPAAIGRDLGLETLGGPLIRAAGAGIAKLPEVGNALVKLAQGGIGGRVAANALTGAGAGAGYAALESGALDPTQLATSAAFGGGFGGLQGVNPQAAPVLNAAGKGNQPPTELAPSPNYSPAEQAVMKAEGSPKVGTGQQWLQWVNGVQARGQLSKEERADIGLDQWLAEKEKTGEPIRREDIQAFVQANRPQVEVVTPEGGGDSHAFYELVDDKAYYVRENILTDKDTWELLREDKFTDMPAWDALDEDARANYVDRTDKLLEEIDKEARILAMDDYEGDDFSEAGQRYADYQLPGGENYHERLITIPTKANPVESGDFSSYTKASPVYQSNHWDEPNVLAHWRANERPVGDVPSYHVEEVQSDWHQAGRSNGYSGDIKELPPNIVVKQIPGYGYSAFHNDSGAQLTNKKGPVPTAEEATQNAIDFLNKAATPQAPFKKSWEQLTIKNALKEAVDRGFTRFSWTPGELQSTATGEAKNVKGNDERYNKRLVNIVNDLGKKYGAKVQYTTPYDGSDLFTYPQNKNGRYVVSFDPGSNTQLYTSIINNKAKVPQSARDEIFSAEQKGFDTRQEAVDFAKTWWKKYGKLEPATPYVDLTPEMINDIKNGKLLSLY